ncbi:MAG: hypothetical protein ABI649_06190, partial [Gaiellaceae bacterium]
MTTHPDLPEAAREHAPAPNQRKFVLAALASYAAALLGIIAFNVTVDPFAIAGTGLFSTAVESDRGAKLTLMEELTTGPEILILGSSRARLAQPDQLKRLTGHSAFNAAVGGGTAADAWVMTRFLSDRFPNQQRGYLWFVDLGVATNGVNPQLAGDRRAQRYLSGRQGRFGLEDVGTYLSSSASSASYR